MAYLGRGRSIPASADVRTVALHLLRLDGIPYRRRIVHAYDTVIAMQTGRARETIPTDRGAPTGAAFRLNKIRPFPPNPSDELDTNTHDRSLYDTRCTYHD